MKFRYGMIPLFLLLSSAGLAQSFWMKKPPQEWTARECEKLLNDSPWAKSRVLGNVLIEDLEKPASVDGREAHPWISYSVRFWSAPIVRRAYVRQLRLTKEFLALPAEQKRTVGEPLDRLIEAEFPDRIVVVVSVSSNVPSYVRDLIRFWQARPEAQWAMDTFLMAGKNRIPPLGVRVAVDPGLQLEIHFPRTLNRQMVVGPGDTSISIEMAHPDIGVLRGERLFFQFKVKEMVLNGAVIY